MVRKRQTAKTEVTLKALFLALLCAATVQAKPPLAIGDRRQVFIDGRFIEESSGVELAGLL